MPIRILSPEVVGQIAAGEVLERPANLVKELIENSIDAGATEIEVQFDNSGREVRIQDNGCGMSAADLPLALQRHATSKIQVSDDLYRLDTFGFRGEALASVAAVSHLTITSRRAEDEFGSRLTAEFGAIGEVVSVAAKPGTEVRVKSLFENVPARLRFLKSEASEHTQIKTTLKALALAHDGVGFLVRSRDQLLFSWPKGARALARASEILQVPALYRGELELDGFKVEVMVGSPEHTMNVNRNIWLFAQGRWIQDRGLSAAVMEGYRNLLMHGEYPYAVVRLTVPPSEIDANVHPTKAQVKFRDPQTAFRVVCRAVRQVLEQAPWLPETKAAEIPATVAVERPQVSMRFAAPEFERTQYSGKAFPLAQVREAIASVVVSQELETPPSEVTATTTFQWRDLQVVGQVHQTYIVAQSEDSLYLIDQHAAHERVMFERLMNSYRQGHMDVQNLLLPLTVDLSAEDVDALHGSRGALERLGLSVERMGPEVLAVASIPAMISETAAVEALRRLANQLVEFGEGSAVEQTVREVFATMACHTAIRAGQAQSIEQAKALLAQMDEYPLSSFCPHGRPVFVRRRFSEIEREFGRIV